MVGTGRIELPTPTVSRMWAARGGRLSLIESSVPIGSNGSNQGTEQELFGHGVRFEELAEYVLDHPDDTDAVVALAVWLVSITEAPNA